MRSVTIQSAEGNKGLIFISESEAEITTVNRFTLYAPGDFLVLDADNYGDLNGEINLKNVFVFADRKDDRIVVTFLDITEKSK